MKHSVLLAALAASSLVAPLSALAASPAKVVELFTSQGCSSCPPANANLIKLTGRPDVLPLSFAVTYWDSLGWKDTFGRQDYTDRQYAYEPGLGKPGPYTPQMVINGRATVVGNNLGEVEQAVASASPLQGPAISLEGGGVSIGAADAPAAAADVWLVRYDPNLVEVPVARGENTGATLPHTHVVHDLVRLGAWSGLPAHFDVANATDGYQTAVLVQGAKGGPILAAVTDE